MQEEELYRYWRYYARNGQTLHSDGHRLRILFGGYPAVAQGPDFIAARFELDGVCMQGDVEMHVAPEDWYRHRHHLDRGFAGVCLHITARRPHRESFEINHRWHPRAIPAFRLPLPEVEAPSLNLTEHCRPAAGYRLHLTDRLQQLAARRFEEQVRLMLEALCADGTEAVFYRAFMRVLGYPVNSVPFESLAQCISWPWLQSWRRYFWLNERQLLALYLAQAGLYPERPTDEYSRTLCGEIRYWQDKLPAAALRSEAWQLAGVRPLNHPHLRLAAWAAYCRHRSDLYQSFRRVLSAREPLDKIMPALNALFDVPVPHYWQNHFALGRPLRSHRIRRFLGRARRMELLMNLVIPLNAAEARLNESTGYYAYLQSLYTAIPLVQNYRSVLKNADWKAECIDHWPKQAVMQALRLLENEYCGAAACERCPIGRHWP